jgi:predicted pyridoxine 5'-phosphate oxidase superfamily flavin-nucleotide-binding protein
VELSGEIKEIFENEPYHQLSTASCEGVPNVSNIGCKFIREDGAIVIVDNYMKKTKENVVSNPSVAILIRKDKISYQIKGNGKYLTEGPEYEQARKWMKSKGDKYPAKGALIVTVESVYDSTTRASAGEKVL